MYYYKETIDGNTFYFTSEEVVSYDGATQVTKEEYDAYIEEQLKIAEALKNKRYYYKKENAYNGRRLRRNYRRRVQGIN